MTAIRKVGVCGAAGTMGAGIAIVAARAGFETVSFDLSDDALAHAAVQTAKFFDKSVARGKMSDMDLTCRMGLGYRDGPIKAVAVDASGARALR
jgi:3-hydroxybutyryl-CoA dehydrogenase